MNSQIQSTQLGFVPAAQVTRKHLVELAAKAMAALEEFQQALTPVDVKPLPPKREENMDAEPISQHSIAWAQAATKAEGGHQKNHQKINEQLSHDRQQHGEDPTCPECNDAMKKRTSIYGDFWGCINYPVCQGKRNSDGSVGRRQSTKRGAMTTR